MVLWSSFRFFITAIFSICYSSPYCLFNELEQLLRSKATVSLKIRCTVDSYLNKCMMLMIKL